MTIKKTFGTVLVITTTLILCGATASAQRTKSLAKVGKEDVTSAEIKLLLAAQETYTRAVDQGAPAEIVARLAESYDRIRAGLGFNKTARQFGAFPINPYSHTSALPALTPISASTTGTTSNCAPSRTT